MGVISSEDLRRVSTETLVRWRLYSGLLFLFGLALLGVTVLGPAKPWSFWTGVLGLFFGLSGGLRFLWLAYNIRQRR